MKNQKQYITDILSNKPALQWFVEYDLLRFMDIGPTMAKYDNSLLR